MAFSLRLCRDEIGKGKLLDYGFGSGVLIASVNGSGPAKAVGYEPFMKDRVRGGLPIFKEFEEAVSKGPFAVVTLFETVEHLTEAEFLEFLERASEALDENGRIFISAPIEIGPAVFLKEAVRFARNRKLDYRILELVKAGLIGKPGERARNIKHSHKGFDFRVPMKILKREGWEVEVVGHTPLPFPHWYGNSQVYLRAFRR